MTNQNTAPNQASDNENIFFNSEEFKPVAFVER